MVLISDGPIPALPNWKALNDVCRGKACCAATRAVDSYKYSSSWPLGTFATFVLRSVLLCVVSHFCSCAFSFPSFSSATADSSPFIDSSDRISPTRCWCNLGSSAAATPARLLVIQHGPSNPSRHALASQRSAADIAAFIYARTNVNNSNSIKSLSALREVWKWQKYKMSFQWVWK